MSCEEKAKLLSEIDDVAQELHCFINTTADFQCLIRSEFDQLNPYKYRLEYVYRNTLTLGDIMVDRLEQGKQIVGKLLTKVKQLS